MILRFYFDINLQGLQHSSKIMNDSNAKPTLAYKAANKLLFHKVKSALGIEKISTFYTAGAPLNEDIKEYFNGLDIMIRELYGSSESGCLGIAQYPEIEMKARSEYCMIIDSINPFL